MAISEQFSVFEDFQNIINGKKSSTAETRHGINPATAKPNPEVPISTQTDVDNAVAAAQKAFKTWYEVPLAERADALRAFADGLEPYAEDFAKLLTQEQGKPLSFATMEVTTGIQSLRDTAALSLPDEIIEDSDARKIVVRHTPLGVSVGIVPWNFPFGLGIQKLAPAVLMGNTIIIKPSPFTPYCGLKVVELAQRFFPAGVMQVLSGGDDLGPRLTEHPGIEKISFTGSSVTGKKVMESASRTLKRVTLELGGKDAAIVCKDVNIEAAAAKLMTYGFINSGQVCLAIKRLYVHEDIYEEFLAAAAAYTKTISVGDGTGEGVFMGPLQNAMQYEKVKTFFEGVTPDQLSLTNGGVDESKPGYFIRPTIVDRPAEDSRLATAEQFGPILPFLTWKDESDVIARANGTRMGLGASVWSNDLDEAARIAAKLQAGSVWVNTHMELDPRAPFGGHKESGIGCELGIHGLKGWTNLQTLYFNKA
ncbi:Aldehyde/histidinol dehydrogenase [Aspergillus germanicus]